MPARKGQVRVSMIAHPADTRVTTTGSLIDAARWIMSLTYLIQIAKPRSTELHRHGSESQNSGSHTRDCHVKTTRSAVNEQQISPAPPKTPDNHRDRSCRRN